MMISDQGRVNGNDQTVIVIKGGAMMTRPDKLISNVGQNGRVFYSVKSVGEQIWR